MQVGCSYKLQGFIPKVQCITVFYNKRFERHINNILQVSVEPESLIPQQEYREIVSKLAERLRKLRKIHKIILFGGVARGTADRLSDIDLLVVAKDPIAISGDVSRLMYESRAGKILPERFNVNIKLIADDEYSNPRGFVKSAIIEGIKLYGCE